MTTSKDFPDSFYRVSIKGLCVRDGKILLAEEQLPGQTKPRWELPGGGLDFGEDIETAFKREVDEEMGLTVKYVSSAPIYVWDYRFENKRGMDWFHTILLAYRVEFEDLNIRPTPECLRVEFFSKEELKTLGLDHHMAQLIDLFNPSDFPDLL